MRCIGPLLLLIVFFSCKKNSFHTETVTGIVLHNVTKQPLANQTVSLNVTIYKIGKRTDEFPDGTPIFSNKQYSSSTGPEGKFAFSFEVDGEWIFSAELVTGEYVQKSPLKNVHIAFFPGSPFGTGIETARQRYDTLFAEKPAFVRYNVRNINDSYDNDTLRASTYYTLKWIGNNTGTFFVPMEYNWTFTGPAIDRIVIDTVPSESEPLIPVKWLYKRTDTIILKNEHISVLPHTTTDYYIHY